MKSSHYLALAVRLFAIALFLYALRQSTALVEILIHDFNSHLSASLPFVISTALVPLLIALLLWFFPMTTSRLILKSDLDRPIEPIDASSLLMVILISLGLYFFYDALTDAVYWLTLQYVAGQDQHLGRSLSISREYQADQVVTVLEFVVSLAIIARARSLASLLLKHSK